MEQSSRMAYRCEATSVEGFIQQLAVGYLAHVYYFYVSGFIPQGKDPRSVDAKLIEKYGIDLSKSARHRRKAQGQANLQYIRFDRFFILLATHGKHRFFLGQEEGGEGSLVRDARERPIKFASYALSCRRRTGDGRTWVAHVGIERQTYLDLKGRFIDLSTRRGRDWLERQLYALPFEAYAPVRRQLWTIFKRVNAARSAAGLELLDSGCLRMRRRVYRPFDAAHTDEPAGGATDVGSSLP